MGDAEKSDPHTVHFRAFVSYSHADAAIAQRLHRKIETYRLPRHLRPDLITDENNGRLGRIFRDREDLPAAEDLSESVKRALAGSQVLVVICSPDARESIWVAKEIALFRALHPHRPVLAAIVRGEPAEAFPAALLDGAEPLAADLRKEGDGWRLGFLKVIAGIADVPLDELVQRDAARRIRRVTAVTGGALVALLVMIGMTIFAIQSRNEAQRQQAEAEGLVEYMLTDLRTELRGVGRLDVMTKVNQRAMDYYEDQGDLSDMPAESLERRARIIGKMGEDDENRGDFELAKKRYSQLYQITNTLLSEDPKNPERIYAHAEAKNRLALLAYTQKENTKAAAGFRKSQQLLQSIRAWGHNRPKWLKLASLVEGNICAIHSHDSRHFPTTVDQCELSVRLNRQLLALQPNNKLVKYDLIFNEIWLSESLEASGDDKAAVAARERSLKLIKSLLESDPNNILLQEQQMEIFGYFARINSNKRNIRESVIYAKKALKIANFLTSLDDSNMRWADRKKHYLQLLGDLK